MAYSLGLLRVLHGSRPHSTTSRPISSLDSTSHVDTFTTDLHEVGEEDVEKWLEEDSAEAQGQGDIGDQRRPGADAHWATTTGGNAGSSSTEVNKLVTTISILTVEE